MKIFLMMVFALAKSENDPYCLQYASDNKCMTCVQSYLSQDLQCVVPKQKKQNCIHYAPGGDCVKCGFFFELDNENKCVEVSPTEPCIFSDFMGECFLCRKGFILNNNDCLAGLPKIKNCAFGMKTDEGVDSCANCADGFTLNFSAKTHSTCVPSTGKLTNCLTSFDGKECNVCRMNFYMDGDDCKPTKLQNIDMSRLAKRR